jgi:HD-GYP domain-containing protein (c-di-GMP phosphodiesterase class II)
VTPIATFAAVMRLSDPELAEHAERVGRHAEVVARRLRWSDARIRELQLGAALHDVGKVNVPPAVLAKPAALDEDELAHVRAHPVEGAWLVVGVQSLRSALPYVLFHHERWDGQGYPTRRAAGDIPVEGRLLAVVDAFDAMTSHRPYRRALTIGAALAEIERCSGTQFDPEIAHVFLNAYDAGEIEPLPLPLAATG